ncbi:MAG: VWA domain-containing protein [Dehalococcoidia bacterium]
MSFGTPLLLLLLPLVAAPALWSWLRGRRRPAMAVAEIGALRAAVDGGASWRLRLRFLPDVLRTIALAALIVGLARPQEGLALTFVPEEGIDVVAVLDVSSSMTFATPDAPTRLIAAKRVVEEFVETLEGDRVGLVIFQSRALVLSPLTLDHSALIRAVRDVRSGLLKDGTAIGLGLAEALNLLRDSQARGRVIVLLTDGQNNAGDVFPTDAAQIAKALGIRIYTIGFTATSGALIQSFSGVDVETLRTIAEITDGAYYSTSTQDELSAAYATISDQERSRVGERQFATFQELAPWLIALAVALLAAEAVLRATTFRRYP